MRKAVSRIGTAAIALGSGLGLCAGAIPAGASTARPASVHPATATNCTWVGTNINRHSEDPHFFGFAATCTDTPTGEWRLDLLCTRYDQTQVTVYGNIVTGSGQSNATCPGQNYEVDGITIENIV
jgi:hypothetical protein